VQTLVGDPRKSLAASDTHVGLMHTVAKPNSRASPHSFSISARDASALRSV
jgi:hypothetical protein